MTSPYTQLDKQRMTIARQRRHIEALEAENAALRAALMSPHALDAALWRDRAELYQAENGILRRANEGWARLEMARAEGEALRGEA